MLNTLIRFSLAQRALVLALAALVLFLGIRKALELPVDVLPDLTKPTVTILTESPGYAPEEVEALVTVPLETALQGVQGVTRTRAINDIALSLLILEFEWGTDIDTARAYVQQRLGGSTEFLPEGITPYMTPATSLMGDILLIGLRDPSGETSPAELRTLADWVVGRRIQSISGIAEVLNMGGGARELHVLPDPDAMRAMGVSFEQLHEAVAGAVGNTTGGFLTGGDQEIMVRNLAMTTDIDAIGRSVVSHDGSRPITIAEVADIEWGVAPQRGEAGVGTNLGLAEGKKDTGHPGVIISVRKAPGFDSIRLTETVEAALDQLRPSLPQGVEIFPVYRQRDFIDLSIGNLKEALRDGAIMVSIILFLFLLNLRVTLITLTAIPLSLGATILVFDLIGLTVNSMTLGGLAVAIGMVVDDAIVDVENVFRRLRENASLPDGDRKPRLEVIALASAEVRSSILYATVLIILVFLPLVALSGVEGRLFTPIAVATILSMAASFVVSLTVIPVLSSFLLNPKAGKEHRDAPPVRLLKKVFSATFLRFSLSQPLILLAGVVVLGTVAAMTYLSMGGNFLPAFREPTAVIATALAPGTSLKTTTEMSLAAQKQLLATRGVETVGFRVGRAEKGDHVVPVSTVEIEVEFDEYGEHHREETLEAIRTTMRDFPGSFSAISAPLADRIGHMLAGVNAKIAVKVYGPDLDELRRLGNDIANLARDIPGLEEARTEQQASVPQLRIEVDRDRALAYGISPGALNDQLSEMMGGDPVGEVYEGQRVYELVVRLPQEWREDPAKLGSIYFDTASGIEVPLSKIARIREAKGPNTILRENGVRRFVVSINPTVADLNTAVEELQKRVGEEIDLPEGYSLSFEGEYEAQQAARRTILLMSVAIAAVITFLLLSYFRSLSLVLLVLSNIPISIVGGILLTKMVGGTVSIATLVGFIAISGIAARNSIMMLSHYLHLMKHEGEEFTEGMVNRGTEERLVPVLMTALSAGIALVPLVLAAHEPGKEILGPVAIVIVGGLISSTVLGLAVTPSVFFHFCRRAAARSLEADAAAAG